MRRRCFLLVLAFLAVQWAIFAAPTAILVDTSRSIPAQQFEEAKTILEQLAPSLVEKGPVTVYAFNDQPTVVVESSTDASSVQSAIKSLSQGGHYTLLYDCLFGAVRDIAAHKAPGVVILVTDGRDENSAVTLEDAADRAVQDHVAVVAAGLGAADARVLRRIATLTGGSYAGGLRGAEPKVLLSDWSSAVENLERFMPPPPKPVAMAKPAVSTPPAPKPEASRNWLWTVLVLLVLGVFAVAVGVVVLLRRTRAPEERACETCGRTMNAWEAECPVCMAKQLALSKPGTGEEAKALPEIDPALMKKGPPSEEMLEHTIVLDEVPVLVLKRGSHPQRMFQLPTDQAVSVGRDKVNTISIADKTLSGQHFRIVPKEGAYYLVDLESTNGTFLDGERITLKELKPESVVHAGQCDFTFRREQKKLN